MVNKIRNASAAADIVREISRLLSDLFMAPPGFYLFLLIIKLCGKNVNPFCRTKRLIFWMGREGYAGSQKNFSRN